MGRSFKQGMVFLLLVAVSALVGLAHYLLTGGEVKDLRLEAQSVLETSVKTLEGVVEKGKETALSKARDATEDAGKDAVHGVVQRLTEALPDAGGVLSGAKEAVEKVLGKSGTAESGASASETDGDIQVFFAPCDPNDTAGVEQAFIAFLKSARTSIHGAIFDLQLDEAAQTLVAKHKQGVAIQLVTDTNYADRDALQACIAAGIPVTFDERQAFMHNKFCIVDGTRVWTGSTNITENCMFRNNNNSVLIQSKTLADDFQVQFAQMFDTRQFGRAGRAKTPNPVVTIDDTSVECYFSPDDDVAGQVMSEIENAQQSIDVMAYVFTSHDIAQAMADRIAQGVQVRGVFEEQQMHSRFSQDKFLNSKGAQIRGDRNPNNMHNKVIVIDSTCVITGSYNFSENAEKENDENLLIIHSPRVAQRYQQVFESLFSPN